MDGWMEYSLLKPSADRIQVMHKFRLFYNITINSSMTNVGLVFDFLGSQVVFQHEMLYVLIFSDTTCNTIFNIKTMRAFWWPQVLYLHFIICWWEVLLLLQSYWWSP